MCLTSDAVYRIRDADAIFRIERKDDQKVAQNSLKFDHQSSACYTSGRGTPHVLGLGRKEVNN